MRISRREFTSAALLFAAGCGKEVPGAPLATPAPNENQKPRVAVDPTSQKSEPPPPSIALAPITVHASQTGTFPYLATIFPLEGAVAVGQTVASDVDPSLRASVIARWPDGSASVVVVAGEIALVAAEPKPIVLRTAPEGGVALTSARVAELVTSVAVDFGAHGSGSLTLFTLPERIWWANERVVCCRYRIPIGGDTLEAVVDIHAFSSAYALVEVVIENGKLDPSQATPARPSTKNYEDATVTVNGIVVAKVSSPSADQTYPSGRGSGTYAGGHEAFRAWYCATWVGGDPGIEVTHDAAALQAHPLFFECWRAAPDDFKATYADDAYAPWSAGRLNVPAMPAGGDHEGIGPLTQWDTRYVQTGSRYARRAVLATALGSLSCNISYRDAQSGLVPSHDQTKDNTQQDDSWPATRTEPSWELAHHPAVGLVAFLCRPSPVFIEIAQKIAIWNATTLSSDVFGYWAQVRGKAWGVRSLAHAIFVTPDDHPFKSPARDSLYANVEHIDKFRTSANGVLGYVWHPSPDVAADFEQENPGMQQPLWMHHFLVTSLHAAATAKTLDAARQARIDAVADWAATQPVRYVNEATAGEWRLHNYLTTVGRAEVTPSNGETLGSGIYAGTTFDALPTYPANLAFYYLDAPPPSAGKFLFIGTDPNKNPSYRYWSSAGESSSAGVSYAAIFWAALVVAVERGVAGADAAWTKVTSELTNLDQWSQSFAEEPRYGRYPRNR